MRIWLSAGALLLGVPAGAVEAAPDAAVLFGSRTANWGAAISPEGKQISYMTATSATATGVMVANIETGTTKLVLPSRTDSRPRRCQWKSETRLICSYGGFKHKGLFTTGFSRLLSIDVRTGSGVVLGNLRKDWLDGGDLISMLPDDPRAILMQVGRVGRYDVETGKLIDNVEAYSSAPESFAADAGGAVRFRSIAGSLTNGGYIKDRISYSVRAKGSKDWTPVERAALTDNSATDFIGFDETGDNLLALKKLDGRRALYRVSTDGNARAELIFSHPAVDVSGVLRLGKDDRPVAAVYSVDATEYHYFDPALQKLSANLSKALPGKQTVDILDESWDGKRKLVFVGRNGDPGRYYLYTTSTRELSEILPLRPQLTDTKLAPVTAVTYPARDGTPIPAYLTLPAGRDPKGLPAIVMPHGGPSARDELGFDWLAQFWASQGYAVLQPNYRGSAGYGESWYVKNGFQSWPVAIGDIDEGARWLIANGTADGKRVAIFGWSYGGYAALQAGVTDPTLYRAIVAVAPVTDLVAMKERAQRFVEFPLIDKMLGSGPHLAAGSPARNAQKFVAPVLIFHGDQDINVDITQARLMQSALKKAGKPGQLIEYPGLDHQLDDSDVRADMLRKSAAFVAASMR